jgi:hypothetical protein
MPMRVRNYLLILAAVFIIMAVPRLKFPGLGHGDSYSDACALDAGKNFCRFGFIRCKFLPFWDDPGGSTPGIAYTHYPPLPDILNGVERAVFRTDSLVVFRIVSLAFSFAGVALWFLFIRLVTASSLTAFLASVFFIFNPAFIYGMDSIHEMSISEMLRAGVLFMLASYALKKGALRFAVLWLLLFLLSLTTFEYIPFFFLFVILSGMALEQLRLPKEDQFILLSAPVAAVLLHFLQNAWYFGAVRALGDWKGSAQFRIYGSMAGMFTFQNWWRYALLRPIRCVFAVDMPVVLILGTAAYLAYRTLTRDERRPLGTLGRLLALFFICGVSWYVFFPAHSLEHSPVLFLFRHLLPFVAITFTAMVMSLSVFIGKQGRWRTAYKIVLFMLITFIVFTGVFASNLPITRKKILNELSMQELSSCLLSAGAAIQEDAIVGVNYRRCAAIRHYIGRRCMVLLDMDAFSNVPEPPKYFLWFSNQPQAGALLPLLKYYYTPISYCQQSGQPVILLRLNDFPGSSKNE